MLLFVYYFFRR